MTTDKILIKLLDWNDKAEAYTRITLGLLFGMLLVGIISSHYHSLLGIPVILMFIVIGCYLMFKRGEIERKEMLT